MTFKYVLLLLSCFALLNGCGEDTETSNNSLNNANPLSHQMDALKKAKNLEAELNKAVADNLKAIDAQK